MTVPGEQEFMFPRLMMHPAMHVAGLFLHTLLLSFPIKSSSVIIMFNSYKHSHLLQTN